jgi:hypothetical protein
VEVKEEVEKEELKKDLDNSLDVVSVKTEPENSACLQTQVCIYKL